MRIPARVVGVQGKRTRPLYIEPGSQSEDGYCDGLNGRPRDES